MFPSMDNLKKLLADDPEAFAALEKEVDDFLSGKGPEFFKPKLTEDEERQLKGKNASHT